MAATPDSPEREFTEFEIQYSLPWDARVRCAKRVWWRSSGLRSGFTFSILLGLALIFQCYSPVTAISASAWLLSAFVGVRAIVGYLTLCSQLEVIQQELEFTDIRVRFSTEGVHLLSNWGDYFMRWILFATIRRDREFWMLVTRNENPGVIIPFPLLTARQREFVRDKVRGRRLLRLECVSCGGDRRAATSPVCPQCGKPFEARMLPLLELARTDSAK
ncbi:MAG: hypothetical protein HZB38_04350 [Planctomycetes bacterium]|nr:hypothetical protein [Planctomycetota bacterium]